MSSSQEIETFWKYINSSITKLIGTMDGLDAEAINWRPIPSSNSLYVLAYHTIANAEVNILERICGIPVNRDRAGEFLVSGDTPELIQQQWAALQIRIEEQFNEFPADELNKTCQHPHRGEITARAILIVVARHTAEHLGQAVLTRDLYLARYSSCSD